MRLGHPQTPQARGWKVQDTPIPSSPGLGVRRGDEPRAPLLTRPASRARLLELAFVTLSSSCSRKQSRQGKYERCRWVAFAS